MIHLHSMFPLLFLSSLAGGIDLVETAANPDLPEEARMAAFEQAVQESPLDDLMVLARDPDADPRQRWVAIRVLGRHNGPAAVDTLLTLIDDDMSGIRAAAVSALGDTLGYSVAEKVAGKLEDPAVMVRAAAADALAAMGDSRTLPYLARALNDPTNHYRGSSLWVRRHYVDAVTSIGTKQSLPILASCLQDTDPDVVSAAISGLDKMNGFSFSDGRTRDEQAQAWLRWWNNQQ